MYMFTNSNIAARVTLVEVHHDKTGIVPDPELNTYIN